jgi:peptide-O-fucosyltransferase
MGRFGNQADHFLGSMAFAKQLNRTFVVPPWRTYKNVPYKEWFKLEKLADYHRVVSAEHFMLYVAPQIWPAEKRYGFCWLPPSMITENTDCQMSLNSFWPELGVQSFVKSIPFNFDFQDFDRWNSEFPPAQYPVIAFKGAPAIYPVQSVNRDNQRYMVLSDEIDAQVTKFINETFGAEAFVGVHLRNGEDWRIACDYMTEMTTYMSSPQCMGDFNSKVIDKEICFPSTDTVLNDLEVLLVRKLKKRVRHVYIATDKNSMVTEIKARFKDVLNLNLVHHDPWLPLIDLAILSRSEFFVGNCISSFTSFVKRERDIKNRKSSFWGVCESNF